MITGLNGSRFKLRASKSTKSYDFADVRTKKSTSCEALGGSRMTWDRE